MLKVVSVSLGSSSRNKISRATFLDQQVELSREGTDGDMQRAVARIRELDGQVDAIGLGGIDLYLCAGKRKWAVRDAQQLARAAKTTPVVDGSGLKLTLEVRQVNALAAEFEARRCRTPRCCWSAASTAGAWPASSPSMARRSCLAT